MLHVSAVPVKLWKTLNHLQGPLSTTDFALAGGTSLALRLGHRHSVDLDFFSVSEFNPAELATQLGYGPDSISGQAEGTLQVHASGVKIEFLRHRYPTLRVPKKLQGVRLWSIEDVAAMKLNAIANRGSKKDFFDVATLLDHYPLDHMIDLYRQKYRPANLMMVIRSLAWFEDAHAEPDPISLNDETWPRVVEKISGALRALD